VTLGPLRSGSCFFQPEVEGIQNVLATYGNAVRAVELWGPTNFTPVLKATESVIRATMDAGLTKYFILLIITGLYFTSSLIFFSLFLIIAIGFGHHDTTENQTKKTG